MNNFKTVAFNTVGYNTADVQDIKLFNSTGGGTEFFNVWEGLPTLVEGVDYAWIGTAWDDSGFTTDGYWVDMGTGGEAIFSVPEGQAVVINVADDSIRVQNAGQVPSGKVTFTTIAGNNFTGNPFPAAIDVQDIKIIGSTGGGTEFFNVWEGLPTLAEGVDYAWIGTAWDDSGLTTDGYWVDMGTGGEAVYPIQPNQGVVINAAAGMKVEITPPYSL